MDKRKPRGSESVVDELALAKSAAWAWYERGSGSDGRSFREVDAWCSKTDPKPSRYKLEALRNVQADQRSKNSLLDTYEIERISNHLQHYIESSRAKCHGGAAAAAEGVQKKKIPRGFWLRRGPVCGSSRDDVVENQSLEHRHRWRPEKGRVELGRPPTVTVTLR
ncbi:hypothetical protein ACS0TY_008802 [Phlomoides rotata]